MRESLAATHHANLQWNPDTERAIDKVAASGLCDELGLLLWKWRYMDEKPAERKAIEGLSFKVAERFKNEMALNCYKIAKQGVNEYKLSYCSKCNGARELIAGNLRIICEACAGQGIRRWTDFERARAMSLSLGRVKTLQRHFNWLSSQIWTLDDLVGRQIKYYVGRYE